MSKPPVNALAEFSEVLLIIRGGEANAFEAVNLALMETYWAVGSDVRRKIAEVGWGKSVVLQLASWLHVQAPEAKGFSAQNLWRMKQLHEAFSADKILSALPRVLPLDAGGSAWLANDDARRGSLEVGKLADLAVLDKDYLRVPVEQIGGIQPQLTLVGGWAGGVCRWTVQKV